MNKAAIIWWRDIPTQIIIGKGRKAKKYQLSERFSVAVDRAAMVAGATDTDAYLEEWRKSTCEIEGENAALALEKFANDMENKYPNSRLGELAKNSGYEPDTGN